MKQVFNFIFWYLRPKIQTEDKAEKEEEEVVEGLYCTIKPGEVPPVPENKFLRRNIEPRQVDAEKKEENGKRKDREESGDDERKDSRRMREANDKENSERRRNNSDYRAPQRTRDAAGRKVKGRGALVGLL